MKIAALLYLIIYYGVLIGLRSFILYKNTGVNPLKKIQKEGIGGFIDKVSIVCFVSVSVIVLNFVFLESNYLWLIPIYYLENLTIGYIGIALSIIGLTIGFIAQLQMGNSWRIKINEKEKTKLIRKGFFKYSRNPIYVGVLLSNLGFFLMMPNALSFTFIIVSYIALEIKIRLEEKYLEENHLIEFSKYKSSVRRWI